MSNVERKEVIETEKTKMSAPWIGYYRKINAIFGNDPEIKVSFDEENTKIIMLVDNEAKANALSKILPETQNFGGVDVTIEIKPSNVGVSIGSVYKTAFAGNPIFGDAITVEGIYDNPITYVMFNNYIIQFWDDNLGDPHGNYTALPQDVARDIFKEGIGVQYSTEPLNK